MHGENNKFTAAMLGSINEKVQETNKKRDKEIRKASMR